MSDGIGEEMVAYVRPAESQWCVDIRDGRGLSDGLFSIPTRHYCDSVEDAKATADRRLESGRVDRCELSVVAERRLEE